MYDNLALSDSGFLFDTKCGSTYSLNGTGTFLLRALIDGVPPAELPVLLCDAYDVCPGRARRDAAEFLLRLADMGLARDEEVAA